jgi:pimeloyl-ACP methyl ester carboxylesterase
MRKFLLLCSVIVAMACSGSKSNGMDDVSPADLPEVTASDTVVSDVAVDQGTSTDLSSDLADSGSSLDVVEGPCDPARLPIVMAHGFMGSGDNYGKQIQRFTSNSYCPESLFVFDWNTLNQSIDSASLLDAFIDDVLATTGASQVELMGHSAGGGLGYTYLGEPDRAAKVAHYVHIASFLEEAPAGPGGSVPTLNLWSVDDYVIEEKGDIPGATTVQLPGRDHFEVVTDPQSFDAMYRFFRDDEAPLTLEIIPEDEITISGRAVALGDNAPLTSGTVTIFALDPVTGLHLSQEADIVADVDETGHYGPVTLQASTPYELVIVEDIPEPQPVHFFVQGFVRSNPVVYVRTLPTPPSLAAIIMGSIPKDDAQTVLIIFSASRAVISGRDSLAVDGVTLSTEEWASADLTSLAFFMYDTGDQISSGEPVDTFVALPFLVAVDWFFDTTVPEPINVQWNDKEIKIPRLRSLTDGPAVLLLD